MINMAAMGANALGGLIAEEFKNFFGSDHPERAERLGSIARVALECLARSDALYHTVEHTLLVTLVGLDILRGRLLSERIDADDFAHVLIACLLHDIGYVRGVVKGDEANSFVIDDNGGTVVLRRGASDASLGPYHVDRSKLFARERLESSPTIEVQRILRAIEFTRFPAREALNNKDPQDLEARLVQAADLIGQLGDPLYLKKANALFYEFEENGFNRQLGYESPADLVERYPEFYWSHVAPFIGEAITYLNVTASGRQWIANLHSHIFCAEHSFDLMGPQR
jgi:hypothetical protein